LIAAAITDLPTALAGIAGEFSDCPALLATIQQPEDTARQNERRGMCDAALVEHK
jgi:hypothetical protein